LEPAQSRDRVSFSKISDIEQPEEIETTTSAPDEKRAFDSVQSRIHEIQEKIKKQKMIVALLGAGGQGLAERRAIASELRNVGFNVVVPEDALEPGLSPSLVERDLLSWPELDLAFVNVESWGSASEFVQFHGERSIAPKLRVIVGREHHPLYGSSTGYLADVYLTHDAVFGHVYMHGTGRDSMPSASEIIQKVAERFRQWKAINSN